jgi:creatinine amidohydrolase
LAQSWARGITELHHLHWLQRDEPSWGRAHHAGHIEAP